MDDWWFDAVCNIYNEISSRFVWSLWKRDLTVYSATGLETKIKRGSRTGGTYYKIPNTHRSTKYAVSYSIANYFS